MIHIILETRAAKLVIRFEVRSFLSRGYFLKCGHLAIPAKLHGPKDDRINESTVYESTVYAFISRCQGYSHVIKVVQLLPVYIIIA